MATERNNQPAGSKTIPVDPQDGPTQKPSTREQDSEQDLADRLDKPDAELNKAKVLVACKLPLGRVIHLRGKDGEPAIHDELTLNGANKSMLRVPGGFGITEVDADYMERWLSENKHDPQVKNGLIFVTKDAKSARDMSKERAGERSGLEGIDPMKPGANLKPENFKGYEKPTA